MRAGSGTCEIRLCCYHPSKTALLGTCLNPNTTSTTGVGSYRRRAHITCNLHFLSTANMTVTQSRALLKFARLGKNERQQNGLKNDFKCTRYVYEKPSKTPRVVPNSVWPLRMRRFPGVTCLFRLACLVHARVSLTVFHLFLAAS